MNNRRLFLILFALAATVPFANAARFDLMDRQNVSVSAPINGGVAPLNLHDYYNFDQLVRVDSDLGVFHLGLLPKVAPGNVENFRRYVEGDHFDHIVVHRSVPGFIIQTGEIAIGPESGEIQVVDEFQPVENEFSASNSRGTVAMAKIAGNPDSATNNWFINLADNRDLDSQNSGFTVFAEVVGNGMSVVDAIARLPVYDGYSLGTVLPFTHIPLENYVLGEGLTREHLVIFEKVALVYDADRDAKWLESAGKVFNVVSNSNPEVITAAVINDQLVLDVAGATGTTEIILQASYPELGFSGQLTVTARAVEPNAAERYFPNSERSTAPFWSESDWFGWYNYETWPILYHFNHGWIWPLGESSSNMWAWNDPLGWIWTSPGHYPLIYALDYRQWVYYQEGSSSPERWFYFYGQQPDSVDAAQWPWVEESELPSSMEAWQLPTES